MGFIWINGWYIHYISIIHYPYISCIPRWTPFQLVGGLPLTLLRCCSGRRRLDAQREGAPMPDVLKLAQRLGKSWIHNIYISIYMYTYIYIYIHIIYTCVCIDVNIYIYIYICIIMYVIISFKYHMIMYVHVLYTTVLIAKAKLCSTLGSCFDFPSPRDGDCWCWGLVFLGHGFLVDDGRAWRSARRSKNIVPPHSAYLAMTRQLSKDDGLYRISCGSNKKPQFS